MRDPGHYPVVLRRSVTVILCTIALSVAFGAPLEGATLRVPEDFSTIGEATIVAVVGDTILVNDGQYAEEVTVNPGLTMLSVNGPGQTKIFAPDTYSNAVRFPADPGGNNLTASVTGFRIGFLDFFSPPTIDSSNPNTLIEDCTILGGGPTLWLVTTVLLRAGGTVRNCDITNFSQSSMFLSVEPNATIFIEDCVIGFAFFPNGMDGFGSGSVTVFKNNTLKGNTMLRSDVIVPGNPTDFTVTFINNIFDDHTIDCDFSNPHPDNLEFRYNCFWPYLPFFTCPEAEGPGNILADPLFCEEEGLELWLTPDSPCLGTGESGEDMGARLGICGVTAVEDRSGLRAADLFLSPPWPNPTSDGATISLQTATGQDRWEATVLDAAGRVVRQLTGLRSFSTPSIELHWDGRDRDGRPAPSGVYYVRATDSRTNATRSLVLVR